MLRKTIEDTGGLKWASHRPVLRFGHSSSAQISLLNIEVLIFAYESLKRGLLVREQISYFLAEVGSPETSNVSWSRTLTCHVLIENALAVWTVQTPQ